MCLSNGIAQRRRTTSVLTSKEASQGARPGFKPRSYLTVSSYATRPMSYATPQKSYTTLPMSKPHPSDLHHNHNELRHTPKELRFTSNELHHTQ